MSAPKAILFLGATGGCGLSALRRSLSANHTCVALCRMPSNLTSKLPNNTNPPHLHIIQGNAHDAEVLGRCLVHPDDPSRLVDTIIFSIGARPTLKGMDDPHVCENGIAALLTALQRCRAEGATAGAPPARIVVVSTTGISELGRDMPLLMVPMYKLLLGTAHKDKRALEDALVKGPGKDEEWTIVRGSLYTGGGETEGAVRVGVEDPVRGVVESLAVGYTISREDVGKWIFKNVIDDEEGGRKWVRKTVTVTY
ncbi:Oxidoreductase AflX [Madurella mycetomatis]|uniref:Oxidoreductase AflX n=1 Tax=Madurella mycetomatis TaxID=100816 RepID=A0A175WI01_9PEZI|nr:Oxidoreductase AflX [Madurella mycetomatis]